MTGSLRPWVAAKDVILKLLALLTTKGNIGYVIEYAGPGVETLSVPHRATIANMGAELGVTTSVFPSDEQTRVFLAAQGREQCFKVIAADADAQYDRSLLSSCLLWNPWLPVHTRRTMSNPCVNWLRCR